MKRCSLITLGIFLFGCFGSSAASRDALALYSWKPAGQPWHFALLPDPFPKNVSRSDILKVAAPLIGVATLKERLARQRYTSCAIIWRDDPPRYTLTYPPYKVCTDIIAFGRQHGLNIERWPSVNE